MKKILRMLIPVAIAGSVPLFCAESTPGTQHWVATWGTSQSMSRGAVFGGGRGASGGRGGSGGTQGFGGGQARGGSGPQRRFGIPPSVQTLNNQTIRMIVHSSVGGKQVRVRLSNAIGGTSVRLGSAHIALRATDSAIVPGSDRVLTFGGRSAATLYQGQVLVSDPVILAVPSLSDLAVSLYFPSDTGSPTSHTFGLHTTFISKEGDFTGGASIGDATKTQSYYWLAGVDILAPAGAATLVTFGDSITDGDQSTPDTNGMWPAVLAARLQGNKAAAGIGVVNAGIAGNRVLGEGGALARMDHDVINQPGVKWIMLLEGINDISGSTRANSSPMLTADDLIAAYREMIGASHLHGLKIIGCTITPFGGSSVYTDAGEAVRLAVNDWIRKPGNFDAFVDFDAAVRDPKDPKRFRPEADSPDMLHPGDSGYKLMAQSVSFSVFGIGR